ncbi:Uncharacterized protein dnm_084100 [Desulfonema magnum]|uniref:Uncharacterized protein n=1 Tax=Desulfonema magnum TaxID=45655 RepID=A0A975BVV7_9BACT|nr:Uncharacterized protein dnm_084100 [Desulfonema magnum]
MLIPAGHLYPPPQQPPEPAEGGIARFDRLNGRGFQYPPPSCKLPTLLIDMRSNRRVC